MVHSMNNTEAQKCKNGAISTESPGFCWVQGVAAAAEPG